MSLRMRRRGRAVENDATASAVDALSEAFVTQWAALDPIGALSYGIDVDAPLTDFSPDGTGGRVALSRRTLADLDALDVPARSAGATAGRVLAESLEVDLAAYEAGDWRRSLAMFSPASEIHDYLLSLPVAQEADLDRLARRLGEVPIALASLRAALGEGLERGQTAPQRQVMVCIAQSQAYCGRGGNASDFHRLVASGIGSGAATGSSATRQALEAAAATAQEAYARHALWLEAHYLPRASHGVGEAVGGEAYARHARAHTGMRGLDLEATYDWGAQELRQVHAEMAAAASAAGLGGSMNAVVAALEADERYERVGAQAVLAFLQDLTDRAFDGLDGRLFAIPARLRRLEVVAATDGSETAHYTPPAEDLSVPGRYHFPVAGRERFALWQEPTTAYHEGVPGHHLQIATCQIAPDSGPGGLNRFRRTMAWNAGYGEGWALYAERLMAEEGFLDDPVYALGWMAARALRAARVVVDIGLHLELALPKGLPGAGQRLDAARAEGFLSAVVPGLDARAVRAEVSRYLGWPGQAISYQVGERSWLEARGAYLSQQSGPDGGRGALIDFHAQALALGPMGLDQLGDELAQLSTSGDGSSTRHRQGSGAGGSTGGDDDCDDWDEDWGTGWRRPGRPRR